LTPGPGTPSVCSGTGIDGFFGTGVGE
jgi:hypothetical protein